MNIPNLINSYVGQQTAFRFFKFLTKNGDPSALVDYYTPEKLIENSVFNKAIIFPDNKKVKDEFQNIINKEA